MQLHDKEENNCISSVKAVALVLVIDLQWELDMGATFKRVVASFSARRYALGYKIG